MRLTTFILVALLLALFTVARAEVVMTSSPTATTKSEAELGRKTAERIEKESKLVDDAQQLARIQAIVDAIAPVTERPDVTYTCKILDMKALNAMALPGGIIYVTSGLLKAVESDDELAGVLAHEIAHNSLYHSRRMLERERKASLTQIATVLAAIYVNRGSPDSDVSPMELITMSEMVKQSLLNGYTVDLEVEADHSAIDYLHKLGTYDPTGLYSVMMGFERMERSRPQMEMGYLRTHPKPGERRNLMEQRFRELGITLNLWRVVNFRAAVIPPPVEETAHVVRLGEVDVAAYRIALDEQPAAARATESVDAINRILQRYYVQQFDVDIDHYQGRTYIRLRRIPVITLTPADAAATGMTLDALAALTAHSIKDSIWRETLKRM